MKCVKPLEAWRTDDGQIVFASRGDLQPLELPCGQCIHCRLERSRQWAVRCVHESQLHLNSIFVTLTYDDLSVPHDGSLVYRHFQLFMKRLRKEFKVPIRFFMCGEYGPKLGRPHYHACLFGCFFDDREFYRELPSGFKLYTSKRLAKLWPHGFTSIGDVTFESAAYVARYVCDKVTGEAADDHYQRFDRFTGEIFGVVPEFARMSLKPGIGYNWLRKYHPEVFTHNGCVVSGRLLNVPKYYKKLLKDINSVDFAELETENMRRAMIMLDDCTPERLAVQEQVSKSRLSFKKRTLV